MSKLFAAVSTLTTLAVLATSGTAFAGNVVRDHRHGARSPATNSPPPAAAPKAIPRQTQLEKRADFKMWYQGASRQALLDAAKKNSTRPRNGGQNSPRSGGNNQQK